MKPTIVLFGASRRVGKDTAADLLMQNLASNPDMGIFVKRTSFAHLLRQEVDGALNDYVGLPLIDVNTQDPQLKEEIVRPMLIAWGKWRRQQDPGYWAKGCTNHLRCSFDLHSDYLHRVAIISDWRYPNEILPLHSLGNVVKVHISREGVTPTGDEAVMDPQCKAMADYCLTNNGSIDDLREAVLSTLLPVIFP